MKTVERPTAPPNGRSAESFEARGGVPEWDKEQQRFTFAVDGQRHSLAVSAEHRDSVRQAFDGYERGAKALVLGGTNAR